MTLNQDQQAELFRALGQIEANTAHNALALAAHTETDAEHFRRLDVRLSSLEQMRWKIAGAAGAAVIISQVAWSVVS